MNEDKKRIQELENIIREMKKTKDEEELVAFPWVGNLGQWFWNIEGNEVVFNNKRINILGYDVSELPEKVGIEFFIEKIHKDDYDRVMHHLREHLNNKIEAYEVEYRIANKDGNYLWFFDRGVVTSRDSEGKPLILSGFVFDVTVKKGQEKALKEANIKLKRVATIDELTGAYNRRYTLDKLNYEIEKFKRYNTDLSIIMLDIDHFKRVNDKFGHNAGDTVLKSMAKLIMHRIRVTDIFCRWGGEEFIILCPETKTPNAAILAEDLRNKISKMNLEEIGTVTASFGVSGFIKDDTVKSLVSRVDSLMYEAKTEGRNRVKL